MLSYLEQRQGNSACLNIHGVFDMDLTLEQDVWRMIVVVFHSRCRVLSVRYIKDNVQNKFVRFRVVICSSL